MQHHHHHCLKNTESEGGGGERERMEEEKGAAAAAATDDEGVVAGSAKREELLGIKLRKGISVGKRGGPFTPEPSWKMEPQPGPSSSLTKPSARKLGASLWEVQDLLPLPKTSRSRTRPQQLDLSDASEPNSPLRPQSAARVMRHIGASFDQHDKFAERFIGDLKPESPASYNSSLEAITPSSSLDLKRRLEGSGYSIKTSAELLKVLNRIWRLEEQLASNVSLVKTLKLELHHAHSHIQELLQEQRAYRYEMDDLKKRLSEDRLSRKNKEQDRIKSAVQSIKNELEDEKKLRRRSESLHRKLGKELAEVNLAFMETLNDLESERKARGLLEDLCDQLAKGLQDYEQEIRNLEQKFKNENNHRFDPSLYHVSKVWTDERLQMKIAEAHGEEAMKNKILERLNVEITAFFQARRSYSSRNNGACRKDEKDISLRRHSLESVHLNGAVGAPQDVDDDDSVVSDLHCFELNRDVKDNASQNHLKQDDGGSMERLKGKSIATFKNEKLKYPEKIKGCNTCSFEHHSTELCNGNTMHLVDSSRGNSLYTGAEECKGYPDNDHIDSCNHFSVSSHVTPIGKGNASSSGNSHSLTARGSQWNYRHASSDLDISKCSSKLPQTVKENSLKEKLLEARLEGQNARLRALKGSSVGLL